MTCREGVWQRQELPECVDPAAADEDVEEPHLRGTSPPSAASEATDGRDVHQIAADKMREEFAAAAATAAATAAAAAAATAAAAAESAVD